MTTVVQLGPPPAEVSPSHRRLQLMSRLLSWLFTALLGFFGVVLTALILGVIFYSGEYLRISPTNAWIGTGPPDSVAFASLPLGQRLAFALVGVVRAAPILMIFWHMRQLFGLYARGEVFTPRNAMHLGRAGAWLCAHALAPFVCHLFLQATGYEIDKNWMHLDSVQAFVLGLLVFAVAQVMQVGREIEEDREGFI
jgi:hypothetical protein